MNLQVTENFFFHFIVVKTPQEIFSVNSTNNAIKYKSL